MILLLLVTGDDLSHDEFSAKLNEHNSLLSDKTAKEDKLSTVDTNLSANEQAQDNLSKQFS